MRGELGLIAQGKRDTTIDSGYAIPTTIGKDL